MSVFFDNQSNLRAGWRLSAFLIVLMPVWFGTNLVLTLIYDAASGLGDPLQDLALSVVINFSAAAIATFFGAAIVNRTPLRTFGIGLHEGWKKTFGIGLAVAGGLIVLLMLGSWAIGETRLEWTASNTTFSTAVLTLGLLVVAAAFEELLFRGYPMQVLMEGVGPWPAMIAMSCIFGLLHAQNPNVSRLGVFNTIVAGMMLSLAYFRSRSLWFPYGVHLGWNAVLGMVVGFPLSGLGVVSLWTTHVSGPEWLLGGDYGPEGGALGTIIFLAGAVAVWKYPIKRIQYDHRFHKNSRPG